MGDADLGSHCAKIKSLHYAPELLSQTCSDLGTSNYTLNAG